MGNSPQEDPLKEMLGQLDWCNSHTSTIQGAPRMKNPDRQDKQSLE